MFHPSGPGGENLAGLGGKFGQQRTFGKLGGRNIAATAGLDRAEGTPEGGQGGEGHDTQQEEDGFPHGFSGGWRIHRFSFPPE